MGEPLICPSCRKSTMIWLDPDMEDLLDNGIMECESCKAQFTMQGFIDAQTKPIKIYCNYCGDHTTNKGEYTQDESGLWMCPKCKGR